MSDVTASRADDMLSVDPAWLSVPGGLLAAGIVLHFSPLATDAAKMVAITLFCVALWIGSPVKPWFTALLGICLIGVTFSADIALSGFQLPATWLVVVGILIGEAARQSGLADGIEHLTLDRMPDRFRGDAVATYRYLLVVLSFASLGLAILVPSALVRVFLLGPILVSIGNLFSERRAKVGIFLGPIFATFYGSSGILTGSLANIIVTGLLESGGGPTITWTQWALWLGPVVGVGRTVLIVGVAYPLYRPREHDAVTTRASGEPVTISHSERRMLAFLMLGGLIWATDFAHGLHPLFGAAVVALLAFTPRIGVVDATAVEEADLSIVFFLGAIFAIAEGLRQTAFTDLAATTLLSYLPDDASLALILGFVVVVSLLLTLLMEGLAVASVLTPILVSFANSAGIPLVPLAMIEAVALNTYFFPYQSAVMVGILGLDVVDSVELTRMASLCSIVTLVVLIPIQIAIFAVVF
ncbi:SLC13 family permease [Haloarcula sp. JP-L23]|uniref:SLC13 family permease n=1 Tax=Haloarcula sp. JP-L23 TaxID=2716717 RepID=UPI00140F35AC|nr:sodium:sulfate symporter [Haloarcula sp. JP-L23]